MDCGYCAMMYGIWLTARPLHGLAQDRLFIACVSNIIIASLLSGTEFTTVLASRT